MFRELMPYFGGDHSKTDKQKANARMRGGGKISMENWKIIGQFVAVLNHVIEVFKKLGASSDILSWLVGEGKDFFEQKVLTPLVEEFRQTERVQVLNGNTILVNLDAPPRLPFAGAVIHNTPKGKGWVRVERRGADLFVDGKKVILPISDRQKGDGVISGIELQAELESKSVLHPNIMDALVEKAPHLIPEYWKRNEAGETLYIFFWDVVFRNPSDGNLFVWSFCWDDGAWNRFYDWLQFDWRRQRPSAQLAS